MAQRKLDQLDDDTLYGEWQHWIRHQIHDEWIELGSKQETFDLIAEIVRNNPRLQRTGGHVLDWMYFNYVAAIAMTLGREMDHQKTANLRHLLHEMEERPQVMTRGRYRMLWPEGDRHDRFWGPDRDFERHQIVRVPEDAERDHIAPAEFKAAREQLIAKTEVVWEFVERTVAHRSPKKPGTVTLKQVHDAVDTIVEMFQK